MPGSFWAHPERVLDEAARNARSGFVWSSGRSAEPTCTFTTMGEDTKKRVEGIEPS